MNTENKDEAKMNPLAPVAIVGGLIVILLIIGVLGNLASSDSNQTTDTSAQAAPTQTVPASPISGQPQTVVANQDPTEECDTAAKNYFNTDWVDSTSTYSVEYITTYALSYQNYYRQANDTCYVLINDDYSNGEMNADGSKKVLTTYYLVNLSEKNFYGTSYGVQVGSFVERDSTYDPNYQYDTCSVSGVKCDSLDSFLSMVNPYLGK